MPKKKKEKKVLALSLIEITQQFVIKDDQTFPGLLDWAVQRLRCGEKWPHTADVGLFSVFCLS